MQNISIHAFSECKNYSEQLNSGIRAFGEKEKKNPLSWKDWYSLIQTTWDMTNTFKYPCSSHIPEENGIILGIWKYLYFS